MSKHERAALEELARTGSLHVSLWSKIMPRLVAEGLVDRQGDLWQITLKGLASLRSQGDRG